MDKLWNQKGLEFRSAGEESESPANGVAISAGLVGRRVSCQRTAHRSL